MMAKGGAWNSLSAWAGAVLCANFALQSVQVQELVNAQAGWSEEKGLHNGTDNWCAICAGPGAYQQAG